MLYYFSGLGNTAFAARRIAETTGTDISYIPDTDPLKEKVNGDSIGFMFPIYSWGVPPIVLEFIETLSEDFILALKKKQLPVWMVCTCGDETGNAAEMLSNCLAKRGLSLDGAWSVIMPNTYVLLPGFDVDSPDLENKKLSKCLPRIDAIGDKINNEKWEWNLHKGSFPALRTKLIYPLFMKWGISTEKWHHTSACVKCGKCVRSCPVKNISLNDKGPIWGDNCLSCLACYHNCPYHAVEYGNITRKKGQYTCPLK